ncbi:MAG: undecaprenyl-diphosphate phosphatase [Deltaproteobacteria bacterium]|nr:undecaprenyl-diphosphate phosphatase [Deltaproteobacteria bacterium]
MSITQSLVLGIIQGVTEFLPISSSAHLILIPWFFQFEQGGLTYDVMLHFATLFATLSLYGQSFFSLIPEAIRKYRERRPGDSLFIKILVGSLPIILFGYFFGDFIERYLRTPFVCVFMLISVSILMFIAEKRKRMEDQEISFGKALIIGIAQAVSLIPGTSRSGITITMGLLLGLERKKAVDFSFLLSIPVVLAASLHEVKNVDFRGEDLAVYLVGMFSATLAGIVSLKFLIAYLRKYSLRLFAFYRLLIAALIVALSKK